MAILNSDLTIEAANLPFCDAFHLDVQHTIGRKLHELDRTRWDVTELRPLLDEVIATGAVVRDHRINFAGIGLQVLLLNAHRVYSHGGEALIVLTLRDNTALELAKEYSDEIVDALRDPFLVLDWELRVKTGERALLRNVRGPAERNRRAIHLRTGQWPAGYSASP
jgi:nitrogen-specific signal transduction histidine kinase